MIFLILLLGLIFRLISLNQSFWLDEAINILAAKQYSFWDFLTKYLSSDFHPSGYFILIWIWTHTFGFSEISARIPSVIFGLLTIWYVYKLGLLIKNKQLGLVVALLVAVNPLHIYYSQEARMYEFASFAAAMSFYYFLKLRESTRLGFLKYVASTILLLNSDYIASLTIVAQLVVLIFARSHQWWKEAIKSWALVGFVGVGFLPLLINQLNIGLATAVNYPVWKEVVGEASTKSLLLTYVKFLLGRISFYNKILYDFIAGGTGLIFGGLFLRGVMKRDKDSFSMIIWLVIPLVLSFGISFWIPVYSYFRVLFTLTPLLILVAIGIESLATKWRNSVLTGVVVIQLIFAAMYLFIPRFQREDWRGAVSFLETRNPKALFLFESNDAFSPFKFYAENRLNTIGALKTMPAQQISDLVDLKTKLKDKRTLFLVDYLVDITDPRRFVATEIERQGYGNTITHDFTGVGFIYEYTLK